MKLAVAPPLLPMLAKRVSVLPPGDTWIFEPKWDGFRTLIFRDGDEVLLQSRDQKSLNRYFPELIAPLLAGLPQQCVLDGEIVVARGSGLDFDALQLRVHPAASRVKLLSQEIPASVVFFDLLCDGDNDLRTQPFRARRTRLESVLQKAAPPMYITPSTTDRAQAADWFGRFEGAGLDGVMAKAETGSYEPNKRVMLKVKHDRDCDCVIAGFRWHKTGNREAVGSLLLGLYDAQGQLQHVGVCASFSMAKRRELVRVLAAYRKDALADHPWRSMPGGKSRWSQGKDLSWEPLRPELVLEVAYDHMQSGRFRHTAQFRRFRSDKNPEDCTYEQLEVVAAQELSEIFHS
jgi:ATP-dependent DNA ligase